MEENDRRERPLTRRERPPHPVFFFLFLLYYVNSDAMDPFLYSIISGTGTITENMTQMMKKEEG